MKSVSRIRSRNSRNRQTDSIAMTPMIDVVFQMLIYFVLTFDVPDRMSQMQVWHPGPPIDAVVVCPPDLPQRVSVVPGGYIWEEQQVSLKKLEQIFNRLADLNPGQPVIVLPSKQSAHRELVTVLDLMNKSGLQNISLISTE